jgi:hypothetical protein
LADVEDELDRQTLTSAQRHTTRQLTAEDG